MILVVSSHGDDHAEAVLGELAKLGATASLLDLTAFPRQMRLAVAYDGTSRRNAALILPDSSALDLAFCRVVWWRRPGLFELHPEIHSDVHRQFAYTECAEAFAGLWHALDAFWVNPIASDEVASHKAYQLRVAQEVGLRIPETLITNDPAQARDFVARQRAERTVFKSFLALQQAWRETRVLKRDEVGLLDNVRYAPVIFQEYIPADVDLRITIVGDEIFASAIHSQETNYRVDYRMEMAQARIEAERLPVEIEHKLHRFMERLGLKYGAIDMRRTPDAQYAFLEINPSGQWLFMEERTGQPITAAMARLFATHDVDP
jgi:glutathione synthase/RimK-type ligase-like ATP-grasp enzyme